jgi:AcrR family transcriptional regulator
MSIEWEFRMPMDASAKVMPRAQRRTNEQRSAEMRSILIEGCISSMCEIGYAGTTTQEICRRAGVTSGAIQHHFGSKDDLIVATLNALRAEMQDRLDSIAVREGSVEARCATLLTELWDTFYGLARYMAVWEIFIGSKGDPALHAKVIEQRFQTLEAYERTWRRTFNIAEGDERRTAAMHAALSFLRGLVLYNDRNEAMVRVQLSIMAKALAGVVRK